jgi:hypothetical protein
LKQPQIFQTLEKQSLIYARIKNIPPEEAYAEYERLNADEPETLSNLEKWSLAGEAAKYGGDAGMARAVQIIPSSLVRSDRTNS